MNASEQLPKPQSQEGQQEENKQQAARDEQPTGRNGSIILGLEKALDALFKAQDHLNTAADRGGDGLSKMLAGIDHTLRGLERELSQLIYRLGNSR
jgi:hypothetical protein